MGRENEAESNNQAEKEHGSIAPESGRQAQVFIQLFQVQHLEAHVPCTYLRA
jgi:hypothetical protein